MPGAGNIGKTRKKLYLVDIKVDIDKSEYD